MLKDIVQKSEIYHCKLLLWYQMKVQLRESQWCDPLEGRCLTLLDLLEQKKQSFQ